jgi:putative transposase
VWLYVRFPLSFREVEELMLERGVIVSYKTIRRWCMKFGQQYGNPLKYLWRAVDQDAMVLDILVRNRRDKTPAKRCFRRLLR